MRKKLLFFIAVCMVSLNARASDLDVALQNTYRSCVGVDEMLGDMKKLAGINTAVTGVGTVAGGGALVAGIKKNNALLGKLRRMENDSESERVVSGTSLNITIQNDFKPNLKSSNSSKAKTAGNWRTGLLAVNNATNIAGTVLATKYANSELLDEKIDQCISAVDELQSTIGQARMDDIDVTEAQAIYDACSEYKYLDLSVIQKRAKGAQISSAIGAGAGVAGVVTSSMANASDGDKEKALDTTSNVLAGGATALSGAATVFNAMQISAIKRVADVAQNCENLLK